MQPDPAAAYLELALWGIKLSQSPSALRAWWETERSRREQYELTAEQIDQLVLACRERITDLNERSAEIDITKPQPTKARPRAPRRQLI